MFDVSGLTFKTLGENKKEKTNQFFVNTNTTLVFDFVFIRIKSYNPRS
jgi:hypothetical protein